VPCRLSRLANAFGRVQRERHIPSRRVGRSSPEELSELPSRTSTGTICRLIPAFGAGTGSSGGVACSTKPHGSQVRSLRSLLMFQGGSSAGGRSTTTRLRAGDSDVELSVTRSRSGAGPIRRSAPPGSFHRPAIRVSPAAVTCGTIGCAARIERPMSSCSEGGCGIACGAHHPTDDGGSHSQHNSQQSA
jgi:hypothetical protein